jgi:hypothetical protein
LSGTNTLAYLASSSATKKKSFITLATGVIIIKHFFITNARKKIARVFVQGISFQEILMFGSKAKSVKWSTLVGSGLLLIINTKRQGSHCSSAGKCEKIS